MTLQRWQVWRGGAHHDVGCKRRPLSLPAQTAHRTARVRPPLCPPHCQVLVCIRTVGLPCAPTVDGKKLRRTIVRQTTYTCEAPREQLAVVWPIADQRAACVGATLLLGARASVYMLFAKQRQHRPFDIASVRPGAQRHRELIRIMRQSWREEFAGAHLSNIQCHPRTFRPRSPLRTPSATPCLAHEPLLWLRAWCVYRCGASCV